MYMYMYKHLYVFVFSSLSLYVCIHMYISVCGLGFQFGAVGSEGSAIRGQGFEAYSFLERPSGGAR